MLLAKTIEIEGGWREPQDLSRNLGSKATLNLASILRSPRASVIAAQWPSDLAAARYLIVFALSCYDVRRRTHDPLHWPPAAMQERA